MLKKARLGASTHLGAVLRVFQATFKTAQRGSERVLEHRKEHCHSQRSPVRDYEQGGRMGGMEGAERVQISDEHDHDPEGDTGVVSSPKGEN